MERSSARWAGAALSGALLWAAMPGRFEAAPLAWLALAPLLAASARAERAREAAGLGFLAGLVLYALSMTWLVAVMARYGHLSYAASALVALLLMGYLAAYVAAWAAFAWACTARRGGAPWAALALAPFAWAALEWLRAYLFSGFPWNTLALTQYRFPALVQTASLGGAYAVSFLLAAANALWAGAALSRGRARLAAALAALALPLLAYGHGARAMREEIPGRPAVRVAVVQGNVAQTDKIRREDTFGMLDRHVRLSREVAREGAVHLVWPEAVIPMAYASSPAFQRAVENLAKEARAFVTFGTVSVRGAAYHNTSLTVSPEGKTVGRYDKMRLVPYGEFVPLKNILFFVKPLVREVGDFRPGEAMNPVVVGRAAFGTAVCYEIIFPHHARAWAERGAEYLVTITNDAWFGRSAAPYQHFAHAVLRAVETRRYVVRAANTGVSGFADFHGRILAESGLFEETFLVEDVRPATFKSLYVRRGDWLPRWSSFVGGGALAWLAWPALARRFKKPADREKE